jgi:hypothetical protein
VNSKHGADKYLGETMKNAKDYTFKVVEKSNSHKISFFFTYSRNPWAKKVSY